MSYLVFARKWRPKDFDEVVGQEHVTQTLKNAIRSQKLAHAYLFSGPQGVGKTSCARILAKALNCAKGLTDSPCGTCPACLEITEGRSLDIIEIDGASNRGIDEIRTLRENVKFAPLNGRTKVYIIDEVHMLTSEAFNALLKTLEEPPPYVKFIFATTQPEKVLPTILSRCQRFDFVRIPYVKIIAKLKEIAASEKRTISDDVFYAMAKASAGSLRDAESILDQMISFSSGEVRLQDVVSVLGIIEDDLFYRFVGCVTCGDGEGVLNLIGSVVAQGKDLNYFLEGLLEYYRHLMVLRIVRTQPQALVDIPTDLLKKISEQAQKIGLGDIVASINHIFIAQDLSRKLSGPRVPLEVLAVKLASHHAKKSSSTHASPVPAPSAKPSAPSVVAPRPSGIPRQEEGPADTPMTSLASSASCTLEEIKDRWATFLGQVSQAKMSVATYLKEGQPVGVEKGFCVIGFPKTAVFFKEALAHKDSVKIIEDVLKSVYGVALRARLDIVEGLTPSAAAAAAAAAQEAKPEETPFLKSALDLFQGKVIRNK